MEQKKLFGHSALLPVIFLLLLLFCLPSQGQERNDKRVHLWIGFSPVLSFYSINPKHTSGTRSKAAYCFSARAEIRLNKKIAFLTGLEYFLHGVNFNSYYIQDKTTFIYDKCFDYKYSLRVNELNLPLQIRFIPKSELKKLFSAYVCFGYMFRYILSSNLQVESAAEGYDVFSDNTKLEFEHPFIYRNGSSFINLSPGIQKNFLNTHHALYAELSLRYALTRFLVNESFMALRIFF